MLVERTETSTPDIPDDLSIPSIPDGIGWLNITNLRRKSNV
jgi:hypothetical protein